MKAYISKYFVLMLVVAWTPATADVMLLVHGFTGHATSWEKSGINDELHQMGWVRAGVFLGSPAGPQLLARDYGNEQRLVYVATLPSESSVLVQADMLKNMIDTIQQLHNEKNLILVGHSAGGVVARMVLVQHPLENIKALVTIASPHMGTALAGRALGVSANHGPFNMVKRFVGGSDYQLLERSRSLLVDLQNPQPGNMLFWLNNQPHPDIHYVSIIRQQSNGRWGDEYVPGFSQNMNNVAALNGMSTVYTTPTAHFLTRQDANMLVSVIDSFNQQSLP